MHLEKNAHMIEDIARERVWPAKKHKSFKSEEIKTRQERFEKHRLISPWPTWCHVTCVSDLMTLLANSRLDHEYRPSLKHGLITDE